MDRGSVKLTDDEERWLRGDGGRAAQFATQLIVTAAEVAGVSELVPVEMAHINSCHYSGRLSLDFAEFLLAEGARLSIPTHTNASLISCTSPHVRSEEEAPETVANARRVMEIYEALGCSPMWSCAPYLQAEGRPRFGQHVVGSESNAVSFFNSALGARTNKYGDLLDISAAIVGRVPLSGRHTDEGRLATHLVRLEISDAARSDPALPHVLGVILGEVAGSEVPVIDGLDEVGDDDLKAVAAAGAASGAVDMFHVVGVTPEAPDLDAATGGRAPVRVTVVDDQRLQTTADQLSTRSSGRLSAVCVGTPHFSISEFEELLTLLAGRRVDPHVTFLATTSRAIGAELGLRGWTQPLADAGVEVVLDTCTYYTPRPRGVEGVVMTNSAKWAYYAPGIMDVDVAFGSLHRCVDSAVAGEIVT